MEFIFQDNYFSGLTYRFPIELDSYKELISELKKNYNFTFIDDLNAYNFRLKTSEHNISVGVNSLPTEIKFELEIYRTEN